MSRETLLAAAAGVMAGLCLAPVLATSQASAAQLHVTAAPIQTWKIEHGLPELPQEPAALVDEGGSQETPAPPAPDTSSGEHSGPAEPEPDGPGRPGDADPVAGTGEQATAPTAPEDDEPPSDDLAPDPVQGVTGTVTDLTQDVTGP